MAILDSYMFWPLLAIFRLSSIAIKYTLIDIVAFDYTPFPIITHTTGMTHFLEA